jgi:3-oxoacyl-[acyl-carrier protein] reductase
VPPRFLQAFALGGLDFVVNNAAITRHSPIELFPIEEINTLLAANVSDPRSSGQAAIPNLNDDGRIISIGSAGAD